MIPVISRSYYIIIALILFSSSNIYTQNSIEEISLEIIDWDLGKSIDWDNYDPSQITFSCKSVIINNYKCKKRLSKKLNRKRIFKGKAGGRSYIRYSLVLTTKKKVQTYRILSDGFLIYNKKRYWKINGLLNLIDNFLQKSSLKNCECPPRSVNSKS